MSDLATPLQYLKGVGPRRAADFSHAGLLTVEDLLYRFPLRYEDRSRLQSIASLKPGRAASLAGRILSCGLRSTRRPGFKIFDAVVDDGTASIRVSWLNQAFLRDVFAAGQHVVLFGPVEMRGSGGLQLTNPQYEILDEDDAQTVHTGRIVPVYERTGTVTPKMQRRLVYDALDRELTHRQFVSGPLSVADIALFPHMASARAMEVEFSAQEHPNLARWFKQMRALPICAADLRRARDYVVNLKDRDLERRRIFWRGDRIEWMLARGFRSQMNVVTMHRPNEPGYSAPGLYVLDDWR